MSVFQAPNVLVIQFKVCCCLNCACLLLLIVSSMKLFGGLSSYCHLFDLQRGSKVYMVGRLIRLLRSKKFWCFQVSCAKTARYVDIALLGSPVNIFGSISLLIWFLYFYFLICFRDL